MGLGQHASHDLTNPAGMWIVAWALTSVPLRVSINALAKSPMLQTAPGGPPPSQEVPFDPELPYLFDGEELLYSARLWTSGYDLFAPVANAVFHRLGRNTNEAVRSMRRPVSFSVVEATPMTHGGRNGSGALGVVATCTSALTRCTAAAGQAAHRWRHNLSGRSGSPDVILRNGASASVLCRHWRCRYGNRAANVFSDHGGPAMEAQLVETKRKVSLVLLCVHHDSDTAVCYFMEPRARGRSPQVDEDVQLVWGPSGL